jgi:hypothetical protein
MQRSSLVSQTTALFQAAGFSGRESKIVRRRSSVVVVVVVVVVLVVVVVVVVDRRRHRRHCFLRQAEFDSLQYAFSSYHEHEVTSTSILF